MKVGFHVYLMPWSAELCLNVDVNEDWHFENRLCHSFRSQVHKTVREELSPVSLTCMCHYKLTLYFRNGVCA